MRKKVLILFVFLILVSLVGCGKRGEKDIIKAMEKKIEKANSYKLSGILEITNNDDTYKYDVSVNYKKDDNYRVSLINKSNNHEQIILKNSEGVYVVTPSLNKSFKFQSEWPNNNSQIYLLHALLNDIKKDENRSFEENGGKYIFNTKVNYPNNNQLSKQKITVNKNMEIEMVEVMNDKNIPQMIMKINSLDFDSTFNDNYFDLDSIIEQIDPNNSSKGNDDLSDNKNSSNNNTKSNNTNDDSTKNENTDNTKNDSNTKSDDKSESTGSIDDIIYPLYIPTGTSLTEQERVSKTNGERVILTFDGEKPFLLVEETSTASDEFSVIPTFGEPFLLTDTIGALADNSITWSSNGIDYYIVSETMSQVELIEIASSISAIPTIK